MFILGISAYFHDSAACLLYNDHIVAAVQEERFSRKKNDERFPVEAIKYCLQAGGITLAEVDHIVFYEKPFLKFERLLETYLAFAPLGFLSFIKAIPIWLKEKIHIKRNILRELKNLNSHFDSKKTTILFTPHHLSHAASAFYPAPFQQSVILVTDGVGEWATTSVSLGAGNSIELKKEIRFPHSVGLFYAAFTYYLGFKVNVDEYKVMGLAPYGKPKYVDLIYENLIDLKSDGSFQLNMQYFNYCAGLTMTSSAFDRLFGAPRRQQFEELKQFHMDVASSVQTVTEQVMIKITKALHEEYQLDYLCMAGGVALNCVVNGKIVKQSGFKNIWIQPAAGDAGGSVGAAYAVYYEYLKNHRVADNINDKMQASLLGPDFTKEEARLCLMDSGFFFEELKVELYYDIIADYIANGNVVGYFKGRSEFGPRALGARSILADPRNPAMQETLNKKIKFRESFRPFAPAVMEEYTSQYFDLNATSPYMLFVAGVNSDIRLFLNETEKETEGFDQLKIRRSIIPAVTHINYSARLQTVNPTDNPDFFKLIAAFYELTNCPMLVNTSFNRMDEPIVNSPLEAITCFKETDMDICIIEGFVVKKAKVIDISGSTL